MITRPALLLALAALPSPCSRRPPEPLTLTVASLEKSPVDAGYAAKVLASRSTSDPADVAIVADTIRAARAKGPLIRCTFVEGGEPGGLRFELSDRSKIYVGGARATVMGGEGCWALDAPAAQRVRELATRLGVGP